MAEIFRKNTLISSLELYKISFCGAQGSDAGWGTFTQWNSRSIGLKWGTTSMIFLE